MRRLFAVLALCIIGCSNPSTPAGYVGYVTKHPYTMPARFYELQTGPTSTGLGWMLAVTNISVTPNTSTEQFIGPDAVLAKDNLRIEFRAHLLWKIDPENVKTFVEKYGETGENPEKMAYDNFIREPFRTYTRDEVQKYDGLDIKENIDAIGSAVQARILKLTRGTPLHNHQRRHRQYSVSANRRRFGRQQACCYANSRTDDRRNPDCKSQGANSGS
jgi:hypothetical protein